MATKAKTPAKRRETAKSKDPEVAQRQADAERTLDQAENGTGLERDKGYAGARTAQNGDGGNRSLDPGQATPEQIKDLS